MAVAFQNSAGSQVQRESDGNILDSEEFLSVAGKIVVPLGSTENGNLVVRDISTIPHILVCGFTGTGKTAFVKTLLSVIISRHSSQDVKIMIYDSKLIDYSQFGNAPHLMCPVISDREKAISSIKYLADESRRRFDLFANNGCKDYEKYNEMQSDATKRMPEIFFVIDDFAYLQLDKNEAYDFLNVLRNGRIAGIHAVVVSSMASTKALQKELISIIPCRICFRLSTRAESRTVLEQSGAEELFVPGEMIYKFQNDLCKCQSAYATYENIDGVMKSIAHSAVSVMSLGIEASLLFADISPLANNRESGYSAVGYDELISEAAEMIINSQRAMIGAIQRKFKIGFNRAARIMDQLQELGVVGPEEGTKPRRVLMTVDEWNRDAEINGLSRISKIYAETSRYSAIPSYVPQTKPDEDDEPEIDLRDFAEFSLGENTLSIHDNKIHYTKPIMTKLGKGHLTAAFSGSGVSGLIYKKPSFFSQGYMTFEFKPGVNIKNDDPYLLQANKSNISDIIKLEFGSGQDRIIRLFLQQLSEDIGIPIKYV